MGSLNKKMIYSVNFSEKCRNFATWNRQVAVLFENN